MSDRDKILDLQKEIADTRESITSNIESLGSELSPRAQIQKHPLAFFLGSIATGALFGICLNNKEARKHCANLLVPVGKLALNSLITGLNENTPKGS